MAENYDPNALRKLKGIDPEALKEEYWNQEVLRRHKPELSDLRGIDPNALRQEYWNQEVRRQHKPEFSGNYGQYNPGEMLSGYETVGEMIFKDGRWLQGYRDPNWPEGGSFPGSPAGVKYVEVGQSGTPKYTPTPGSTDPNVVSQYENDRTRRRAWSEHNTWELYAAYRDGTGYRRVTGGGEGGVFEMDAARVKEFFEGNPTRDRRRKHYEDWKAGKVRINGLDFNDRREDGSGPGPVVNGQVDWSNPPENFEAPDNLKPDSNETGPVDKSGLPQWKVGLFTSIAHGSGWFDVKGVFGEKGQYYSAHQVQQIMATGRFPNGKKHKLQEQRQMWRSANGFDVEDGWATPPPVGIGSASSMFAEFYDLESQYGAGNIPAGTMIGHMTVEEFSQLVKTDSDVQKSHDNWLERHPQRQKDGVQPIYKPEAPTEPEFTPDPSNPMGLARAPAGDMYDYERRHEAQINQAIAEFEAMNVEGADVYDLVMKSREIDQLMEGRLATGRTINWDPANIQHNQMTNVRGQEIKASRYDPWAWQGGQEFRGFGTPNYAGRNLQAGQEFVGGAPPPAPAPGPQERQFIPPVLWDPWVGNLQKQGYQPSVIRNLAHKHWQPDYTVPDIDSMVDDFLGLNQPGPADAQADTTSGVGVTGSSTRTGADVGDYKPQTSTQDYRTP